MAEQNEGSFLDLDGVDDSALGPTEDLEFEDIDEDLEKFKDDELVQAALRTGADLKEYARQIEEDLRVVERESIHDYIKESENLAQLHSEIRACDITLERMEQMLGVFQGDLGKISSEIKSLQDQSLSMSVKLKNRRAVESKLGNFIDGIAVPPKLISGICEDEVNEAYLEFLLLLRKKFAFADSQIAKESASARDVQPELEKLRLKAVDRVREFLLQEINALGNPRTNFQIRQQNVLLKFKYFAQFLKDHAPTTFDEVRGVYVDTLSKVYVICFRNALRTLPKLQYDVASRSDVMVEGESGIARLFSAPRPAASAQAKGVGGFALGDRAVILSELSKEALVYNVESQNSRRHPPEAILRSIHHLLMDTATSEFLFLADFFAEKDMAMAIFRPTLDLISQHLTDSLSECHDAVALLLMVRIVKLQRGVMEARRVGVLDGYMDGTMMLLWPRLKAVFNAHHESIKSASARALVTPTGDREPHYVTRRFGELAASVFVLFAQEPEEMLTRMLDSLAADVDLLLRRIADEFTPKRRQLVFLINQYDLIRTIFAERHVPTDKLTTYEERHQQAVLGFIDEELVTRYPTLVAFVKEMESLSADESSRQIDVGKVLPVVSDFVSNWKTGIEQVNTNVMSNFTNMRNGMQILKQVLTQLLLYYTRFMEIVKKHCKDPAAAMKDVVTIPTIMAEIKKYSRTV